MKKNYLASLALVFCVSLCSAQTEKQESKTAISDKQKKVISTNQKTSVINPLQNESLKRTKIAPEVFYVVDDKAVDYKAYLQHLQKTKNQH
ncbi:hypothetical protein KIH23_10730 [Flavobacterium sp. CYK-55]|uniref:hypothetical protein n=1 Tax=Flavobacterium sp. CYK-55 TaxID=2835529 RepID=UPI001BD14A11|nr:hypothetical protein [Flavobacterium sp. CYK-55]MBS7787772.1 hypothetical protein [Flavobacterium sp. CYK-55]